MDIGLTLHIRNPKQWHRPDHELYQLEIDNAIYAEKLGFKHIWSSEHHFAPDGWSPSTMIVMSAIAARTERIRLGTFVLLLPLYHPIRVAEDAATVDILSNGRFDLGVGTGNNIDLFAPLGIPFHQRMSRMFESLEIIRRCLSEDEFSFHGKYWKFDQVRMTTKPVQRPFPLWVGTQGARALALAGAGGYQLASAPRAEQQRIYDDALRKAGHEPKNFRRAGLHFGHVAETTEKAWDEAEPYVHYHMLSFYDYLKRTMAATGTSSPFRDLTVPPIGELRKSGRGPYGPALIGSPEDIIRALEAEQKTNPMNEAVLSLGVTGMDPLVSRRSMELIAKEILPHFQK